MKMGDKRLKRLDALGVKTQNKTTLAVDPKNRAERRKLDRTLRHAGVPEDEREIVLKEGVSALTNGDG
jgi:hypothetical protein